MTQQEPSNFPQRVQWRAAAPARGRALPRAELRTPQDSLIAAWRLPLPPAERVRAEAHGTAGTLGQCFFLAPQANGWPDRAADWATPELLLRQIDFSWGLAGRTQQADARLLAERALGPLLTDESRTAIARAGSRAKP